MIESSRMIAKVVEINGIRVEFGNYGNRYYRLGVSRVWNHAMRNINENYTAEIRSVTRSIMS
jgi:hypothetical protein